MAVAPLIGKSLSAVFLYNTLFNKVSVFIIALIYMESTAKLRVIFGRIAQVFNDCQGSLRVYQLNSFL